MELKYIEKVLEKHVENITTNPDEHGFNRTFEFNVRGSHYKIVWFVNVSTLFIGEYEMKFDDMTVDGCWPNQFKKNINFKFRGQTIGILPIEPY